VSAQVEKISQTEHEYQNGKVDVEAVAYERDDVHVAHNLDELFDFLYLLKTKFDNKFLLFYPSEFGFYDVSVFCYVAVQVHEAEKVVAERRGQAAE
jgi:hypothetical protein